MPVTASFPPSISRGGAVCKGPDIDGIGKGAGSAGFVSAGAALGALEESEGALCVKEACAPNTRTRIVTRQVNRVLKVYLLNFRWLVIAQKQAGR